MPFTRLIIPGLIILAPFALGEYAPAQTDLPAPVLISPVEDAVMDNGCRDQSDAIKWDFDWEDVWGATSYHIKVWHNPERPVVDDTEVSTSEYHDVSGKSHIIERNRKGWCWKVRARAGNRWSDWSEVRCFEAEPLDTDCPGH